MNRLKRLFQKPPENELSKAAIAADAATPTRDEPLISPHIVLAVVALLIALISWGGIIEYRKYAHSQLIATNRQQVVDIRILGDQRMLLLDKLILMDNQVDLVLADLVVMDKQLRSCTGEIATWE